MKNTVFIILLVFSFSCQKEKTNPYVKTIDNDFSKGLLCLKQKVTLNDVQKFHGHLCDGLVVAFQGLELAFQDLYPNGEIDRTNTRIVSKPSPCLTDAAIYLTGGRYQFNTFYVSNEIEGLFIVQRIDHGMTLLINLKKGVKPPSIDSLGAIAEQGNLSVCELDKLKKMENDFSDYLLKTNPANNFSAVHLNNFEWKPDLKMILSKQIL